MPVAAERGLDPRVAELGLPSAPQKARPVTRVAIVLTSSNGQRRPIDVELWCPADKQKWSSGNPALYAAGTRDRRPMDEVGKIPTWRRRVA
jgi:hypothetical protein